MSHKIITQYDSFPFELPLILDGATGTNLIKAGMPSGVCPETWILENPETLVSLHRAYEAAGSDAVYAPTFGGNAITLASHKVTADKAEIINGALASMARSATRCLIGGDVSPTGRMMYPLGNMTFEIASDIYAQQAKSMSKSCDFFVTETNISLAEARAAVYGIRSVSDKPVFATISVSENGRTLCGDTPLASLISLAHAGVSAFGLNCSCGPESMIGLLSGLVPFSMALGVPLIAKPNAGKPHDVNGQTVFDMGADEFASHIADAVGSGIMIVGGCCGTSPEYISAIKEKLNTVKVMPSAAQPDVSRLAATNSAVCEITADAEIMSVGDFIDGDESAVVNLKSRADADELIENMYMLPAPFAVCGDCNAIDIISRKYCGYAPILQRI